MRKQIKPSLEIGDINYVKPGEFFVTLSDDGKTPTSVQRRKDNLDMEVILGEGSSSEDNSRALKLNLTEAQANELVSGEPLVLSQITDEIFEDLSQDKYDSIVLNFEVDINFQQDPPVTINFNKTTTFPVWDAKTKEDFTRNGDDISEDTIIAGPSYKPSDDPFISLGINLYRDRDGYYLGMGGGAGYIPAPYISTRIGVDTEDGIKLNISARWLAWLSAYQTHSQSNGQGIIIDSTYYRFYSSSELAEFLNTTERTYPTWSNMFVVEDLGENRTYMIGPPPEDQLQNYVLLTDVTGWNGGLH